MKQAIVKRFIGDWGI